MRTILNSPPALTRRGLFVGPAAGLAACATRAGPGESTQSAIAADLAAYAQFGPKWAGGAGDNDCGDWIEARLAGAGYATERQRVAASDIGAIEGLFQIGALSVRLAVHDAAHAAPGGAIEGPVAVWTPAGASTEAARGAIVVAHLNARRWSSAMHPEIRDLIERAGAVDAAALVLVTHGPTGECIRLNRPLEDGGLPICLMAPRNWHEIRLAPAATRAALTIERTPSARQAFNVIARQERGNAPYVVISTPRSGWGICAGERGPGVAIFLAIASWARNALARHNLIFVATSAHEFEGAGAQVFLQGLAPPGQATRLWAHLGAGFAARDWHEAGARLAPLPSPDPQRFLLTSEPFLDQARACFTGAAGLEAAYAARPDAAGELGQIASAGYANVIGLLGAHRFHHTAFDDMRCVEPRHAEDVAARLQRLMLTICDA